VPGTDLRSRRVEGVNGLSMHVLEAGEPGRPCVLLLHGFPELAYSWRKLLPRLAEAGYYAVAPDQRGYGATTGWNVEDLSSFAFGNLVLDVSSLLGELQVPKVHLVGHDFGSPVAGACVLLRPELFRSVTFMSAPFGGAQPAVARAGKDIHAALAELDPPRKHYQWYYSTPPADRDMRECKQGLHAFLRAYYHVKSADWAPNRPYPLQAWTAEELAKLPRYYVMDLDKDMAETVADEDPGVSPTWLSDVELKIYSDSFARTTFQGGLNWYRCATGGQSLASMQSAMGRKIFIPACFIAGASDWGIHQKPGEMERMEREACTDWRGTHLIQGAGHWVQQEQPQRVADPLLKFLEKL
jgi:pimeloyl-ACP methyl ester carboxylesterase